MSVKVRMKNPGRIKLKAGLRDRNPLQDPPDCQSKGREMEESRLSMTAASVVNSASNRIPAVTVALIVLPVAVRAIVPVVPAV